MVKNQYFIEFRYYNDGTADAVIMTKGKAESKGYHDGYSKRFNKYDLYIDGFKTYAEALKNKVEALDYCNKGVA